MCAEHFTDDCFVDPIERTKLRKTTRPVTAPLPSIFQCNIGQYIKSSDDSAQSTFNNNHSDSSVWLEDDPTFNAAETHRPTICKDPIAVETPALTTTTIDYNYLSNDKTLGTIKPYLSSDDEILANSSVTDDAHHHPHQEQDVVVVDELSDDNFLISYECLSNNNIHLNNDDESSSGLMVENANVKTKQRNGNEDGEICRLCAIRFNFNGKRGEMEMLNIFEPGQEHFANDIQLIMPNVVCVVCFLREALLIVHIFVFTQIGEDDGLPQRMCSECYAKVMDCARTIKQFYNAQERL